VSKPKIVAIEAGTTDYLAWAREQTEQKATV